MNLRLFPYEGVIHYLQAVSHILGTTRVSRMSNPDEEKVEAET